MVQLSRSGFDYGSLETLPNFMISFRAFLHHKRARSAAITATSFAPQPNQYLRIVSGVSIVLQFSVSGDSSCRNYNCCYGEQQGNYRNDSKEGKLFSQGCDAIGHGCNLLRHAGHEFGLFSFICLKLRDSLLERLCAARVSRLGLLQELL
jgi:hypothetical protein